MSNKNFSVKDLAKKGKPAPPPPIPVASPIHQEGSVVPASVMETQEPKVETPSTSVVDETKVRKKREEWVPDASLTDGLEEDRTLATYNKDEMVEEECMKDLGDEVLINDYTNTANTTAKQIQNIDLAKERNGVSHFTITDPRMQVRLMAAAYDDDDARSAAELDKLIAEMIKLNPSMLVMKSDVVQQPVSSPVPPGQPAPQPERVMPEKANIAETPQERHLPNGVEIPTNNTALVDVEEIIDEPDTIQTLNVDIDDVGDLDTDDVNVIQKRKNIVLNIVENEEVLYDEIVDADDNEIDSILSEYSRNYNDELSSLPASQYRCTFKGLTYSEVLDLMHTTELNTIDAEVKKWTIAFRHIGSPSIGSFKAYKWFIDPATNKKIKFNTTESAKKYAKEYKVSEKSIKTISQFEDFLMKTSYIDINYILYKILIATSREKETISITCKRKLDGGVPCNNNYEFIYNPAGLLDVNNINEAVMLDMKNVMEATGDQIMQMFNDSPVTKQSTIQLAGSKIGLVFGHVSAYDYLNEVYPAILKRMKEMEDGLNETEAGDKIAVELLKVVKSFVVPTKDGRNKRIRGVDNILKVIKTMDEVDWQTMVQLYNMMVEPYTFNYLISDLVCPSCGGRSSIPIENIEEMLFIIARSLSSAEVSLKTN